MFYISHPAIKTAQQQNTCLKGLIVPMLVTLKKDTADYENGVGAAISTGTYFLCSKQC